MNSALDAMLARYKRDSSQDHENALKEIIQEIALLGLWRAKFFEKAAFYGGTALRLFYGLDRFSEDLDFSLLKPSKRFALERYNEAIQTELGAFRLEARIETEEKESRIPSAFIKADTRIQFLNVNVPERIVERLHRNAVLKVKFEVDIDPPGSFSTEPRTLLLPIPFSVQAYSSSDLFAGKMHALLHRNWNARVKGRDWYDFAWYVARDIPLHLKHLESRMRQTGHWDTKKALTSGALLELLRDRIAAVDFKLAAEDVRPFLRDPQATKLWSEAFFSELVGRVRFV